MKSRRHFTPTKKANASLDQILYDLKIDREATVLMRFDMYGNLRGITV